MAGILDFLADLFDSETDEEKSKRIQQAAKEKNRDIVDPKMLLKEQAKNGLPVDRGSVVPFSSAANPKADDARRQAIIDAENERLNAEELARQAKTFLGSTNSKANDPALTSKFMDNQALLNDFRESEARRAADDSFNNPSPNQPRVGGVNAEQGAKELGGIFKKVIAPNNPLQKREPLTPDQEPDPIMEKIKQALKGGPWSPAKPKDDPYSWPLTGDGQAVAKPDSMVGQGRPEVIGNNGPQLRPSMVGQGRPEVVGNNGPELAGKNPPSPNPAPDQTGSTRPSDVDENGRVFGIAPALTPEEAAKLGPFPSQASVIQSALDRAPKDSDGKIHVGNLSFDPSVIGPALAALDPRNASLAAGLLDRADSRRKSQEEQAAAAQQQKAAYDWLLQQGVTPDQAAFLSSNEGALKDWWDQKNKPVDEGSWKSTTVKDVNGNEVPVLYNDKTGAMRNPDGTPYVGGTSVAGVDTPLGQGSTRNDAIYRQLVEAGATPQQAQDAITSGRVDDVMKALEETIKTKTETQMSLEGLKQAQQTVRNELDWLRNNGAKLVGSFLERGFVSQSEQQDLHSHLTALQSSLTPIAIQGVPTKLIDSDAGMTAIANTYLLGLNPGMSREEFLRTLDAIQSKVAMKIDSFGK